MVYTFRNAKLPILGAQSKILSEKNKEIKRKNRIQKSGNLSEVLGSH